MKTTRLVTTSVKADPDKVKKLQDLGLELSTVVRLAIDEALGVCPVCKQKTQHKSSKKT